MPNDKELLQQALDALNKFDSAKRKHGMLWQVPVIEAIKARLAQPEPEPVAWTIRGLITDFSRDFSAYQTRTYTIPLYTAPPQREWIGLTDAEYEAMAEHYVTNCYFDTLEYARAIEAKLKEKNT